MQRVRQQGGTNEAELQLLHTVLLQRDNSGPLPVHLAAMLSELKTVYYRHGVRMLLAKDLDHLATSRRHWLWLLFSSAYLGSLLPLLYINLLLLGFGYLLSEHQPLLMPLLWLAVLLDIFAYLLVARALFRLDRWVERELPRSGLAERLALGSAEVLAIWQRVPYPLRILFCGPAPTTARQAVRFAAYNLDWFIRPPRAYFRLQWPTMLLVFALGACNQAFATFGVLALPGQTGIPPALIIFMLTIILVSIVGAGYMRSRMFLAHFYPYLRGRLET